MDTDRLIATLAADNGYPARPPGPTLAIAVPVAWAASLALLLATLGLRPDFMQALRNPLFDLKFVVTLALALVALALALQVSRPQQLPRRWFGLLLVPVALLALGIAGEALAPPPTPALLRLMGHNALLCMASIPALSLPLLAAALIGLRQGAPARPALAGAIAGLLSSGLAAALYAAHCIDDSPLFVATWYTLAVALVTLLGAAIGARVLRY
ncbi:NrsF family protein [Rhodopseudomonas palustris]